MDYHVPSKVEKSHATLVYPRSGIAFLIFPVWNRSHTFARHCHRLKSRRSRLLLIDAHHPFSNNIIALLEESCGVQVAKMVYLYFCALSYLIGYDATIRSYMAQVLDS